MNQPGGVQSSLLDARDRARVMGILNVTPDSFSDGGTYLDTTAAVKAGLLMLADGADILDVGGESTRPGAEQISAELELSRVLPVVRELAAAGAIVSIDTTKAEVARACVEAGATIVNDVSCASNPELLAVAASTSVDYVLMHNRGPSTEMHKRAEYTSVVEDVLKELKLGWRRATEAGIATNRIVIDPGLGFAKKAEHNWELLRGLSRILELGRPVLLGASRKSFLGALLGAPDAPRPVDEREAATQSLTTYAALAGAWGVRVHEVRAALDACHVVAAIQNAGPEGSA